MLSYKQEGRRIKIFIKLGVGMTSRQPENSVSTSKKTLRITIITKINWPSEHSVPTSTKTTRQHYMGQFVGPMLSWQPEHPVTA